MNLLREVATSPMEAGEHRLILQVRMKLEKLYYIVDVSIHAECRQGVAKVSAMLDGG